MKNDDDDELLWEEFMKMSDDQIEAELERLVKEQNEWFEAMPFLEQYRYCRRRAVENCLRWRKLLRENAWMQGEFGDSHLRDRQVRLVKLRIWFSTGMMPGSA